jgi:integrase
VEDLPKGVYRPHGCKTYWIRYCITGPNGRSLQIRKGGFETAEDASKALAAALDRERLIRNGTIRREEIKDNEPTLENLRVWFLKDHETVRPSTYDQYRRALGMILGHMKAVYPTDITPKMWGAYKAWRRETKINEIGPERVDSRNYGASDRTVNIELQTLNQLMCWAVAEGHLQRNPVEGLEKIKNVTLRKTRRPITLEEVERLIQVSPEPFNVMWAIVCKSGLRSNELRSLRWQDVDLKGGFITIPARIAKSKREKIVPIIPEVAEMLRQHKGKKREVRGLPFFKRQVERFNQRRQVKLSHEEIGREAFRLQAENQNLVFLNRNGRPFTQKIVKNLQDCLDKAGVDARSEDGKRIAVDVHALRGTFCTNAAAAGMPISVLGEIVGHTDPRLTKKYYIQHHAEDLKQAALEISKVQTMTLKARAEKKA